MWVEERWIVTFASSFSVIDMRLPGTLWISLGWLPIYLVSFRCTTRQEPKKDRGWVAIWGCSLPLAQVFHYADLQPILCDLQTHRQAWNWWNSRRVRKHCGSVPLKKCSSLPGVQADQLPHWESSRYWRIAGSLLRHKLTTLDFLWKQSSPTSVHSCPIFSVLLRWGIEGGKLRCFIPFFFMLSVESWDYWYPTFAFERLECPTTGCIPWQESSFWGQMRHVICCFLLWQTKSENADLLVLSYPVWIWFGMLDLALQNELPADTQKVRECQSSCNVTETKSEPGKIEIPTLLVLQKLDIQQALCGKGRDTEGTGTTFNKGLA